MNYKYIKNLVIKNNFNVCGITQAIAMPEIKEHIEAWVRRGLNAEMAWIERNNDVRSDVSLLLEGAKTIIVVAKYYNNKHYDLSSPRIARYAQEVDYHITMKKDMESVAETLRGEFGVNTRCCVDSVPLAERFWAQKAGLGWIGKSGMLINKEYGGFTTLGVIIVDQECDIYDIPSSFNGCGGCSKCVCSCPTSAILEGGEIDCRRCLSYLTVEHRGEWPPEIAATMASSEWLYGCDSCIEVCPWSIKAAKKHGTTNNTPPPYIRKELLDIKNLSNSSFKRIFGHTPLFHSGKKNIERNVCIIIDKVQV